MEDQVLISVVVPVYGCETSLVELYLRLKETLSTLSSNSELIFVNDHSPDASWAAIQKLSSKDSSVKGLNLARNFGQHYAITAGLDHCTGEWVVVMDCDLQDKPEEIITLFNEAKKGYQIVFAQRVKRKDHFLKRITSKLFYFILGYLTNTKQDPTIANFGIYHRDVITAILSMKDYYKYFPTMVRWVGFDHTKIHVSHAERTTGSSSYSVKKLLKLALDIILSFSDKPLRLTIKFGFTISSLSILFALYNLYLYYNDEMLVPGYTSLIISIWFLSGLIMMLLGVVGLYIGKAFDTVKQRPTYIIKDKTF